MLSKDKIDIYLGELGEKILAKFGSEASIDIVIVGGAAIAIDYTFRESTMDIDTFSRYSTVLDELAVEIAAENNLPMDWRDTQCQ